MLNIIICVILHNAMKDEIEDYEDKAEVGKLTAAVEDIGQTASWREADDTDTDDEEVIILHLIN